MSWHHATNQGTQGMNDRELCADTIYEEARLLDRKAWDAWLDLYLPEAEYWIPAWQNEHEYTDDPDSEISLIYYGDRGGLEDRVFRIRTGLSSASTPLARTSHLIGNVQTRLLDNGDFEVFSSWQVTSFRHKETSQFAGWYEHTLRPFEGRLRIRRKKIVVVNDLIPGVLDIYSV